MLRNDMNQRIKSLTDQAAALPPDERAALVEGILQTLEPTDQRIDELWAAEAKSRLAAYRRGEMEAFDFDEVMASLDSEPQRR